MRSLQICKEMVIFWFYQKLELGQKNISSAPAAIVMSLEGIVAAVAAWIMLNQILGLNNIIGCVLILCGILLSQLPPIYEKNYK